MTTAKCQNCGKEAVLRKVKGYLACPDCEIQAHMPFFMRRPA